MGILNGFFSEDLAIDLGAVNTIVYAPTQGVVLNEPSVLALNKYSGEVLSVGSQALKLLGREPKDTEVYRPIRRGAIDNFEISQKFLRALISRVQHNDHPRRSHLVIGVPGSSTPLERRRRSRHTDYQMTAPWMIVVLHSTNQRAQKFLRDFEIVYGPSANRPVHLGVLWFASQEL